MSNTVNRSNFHILQYTALRAHCATQTTISSNQFRVNFLSRSKFISRHFCDRIANFQTVQCDGYSNSSNNRTASNKSIHRCNFGHLLHKIARFWPILAHSCHKINNRTGTIIKRTRVFWVCVSFSIIQNVNTR